MSDGQFLDMICGKSKIMRWLTGIGSPQGAAFVATIHRMPGFRMTTEPLLQILKRTTRAAIIVTSHVILAAIMLIGIWLVELLITRIWAGHEPVFFQTVPIRYMFQVMDFVVIVTFALLALIEVTQVLRER
jgi:type IV secretory pathway TrbD component